MTLVWNWALTARFDAYIYYIPLMVINTVFSNCEFGDEREDYLGGEV